MIHPSSLSIDEIVNTRGVFDDLVYTPLEEALEELFRRREDASIDAALHRVLKNGAPEVFAQKPRAVMFRQVATPNYEIRRFLSIMESIESLQPLFWEYHNDKYTSNNEWKHSLGKLFFYKGTGKKGGSKIDAVRIIDFNTYNGKPISTVKTLWNESLIDFHHDFFSKTFRHPSNLFFDASEWFVQNGKSAEKYYIPFLALFIKHGILFENFLLDEKELSFTREIFLPAFFEVMKETGLKPLIVSLEPTDIEGDQFWMCHPVEHQHHVDERLRNI